MIFLKKRLEKKGFPSMRVLIDTNVILDVLYKRKDFYDDSLRIWKLCETKQLDGYISSLSIPNIVYILRRELDSDKTFDIIKKLSLVFHICDLKEDMILKAAKMRWDDFEDALQIVTAEHIFAQFIISRNLKDFINSNVSAILPCELIGRLDI